MFPVIYLCCVCKPPQSGCKETTVKREQEDRKNAGKREWEDKKQNVWSIKGICEKAFSKLNRTKDERDDKRKKIPFKLFSYLQNQCLGMSVWSSCGYSSLNTVKTNPII